MRECVQDRKDLGSGIRHSLKIGPTEGPGRLDMPDRLVLTNYDTLLDCQFPLCLVDWGCVIFDVAQEIKNSNTMKSRAAKGLKADFRLAMTGTPVENSLVDIWSIFDTVKPGLLGTFKEFRQQYVARIQKGADDEQKKASQLECCRKLRQAIGHHMLRRTKEGQLRGLPVKTVHDGMKEPRYCAYLSGAQLEDYDAVINAVKMARCSGDLGELRKILLPSLRQLQTISLHPAFYCREPKVPVNSDDLENYLLQSAKMVLLLNILKKIRERKEKVILFVINKNLQRFLAYALGCLHNLPKIAIVNGDTASVAGSGSGGATRMELIRQFEARPGLSIICMSPLAAGVGLNVTGANNVIHLECHWNPAKEAQATDRFYRIRQTRDVHVYIPIVKHPRLVSFDENLHALLQHKVDLKDAVFVETPVQANDFNLDKMAGGA